MFNLVKLKSRSKERDFNHYSSKYSNKFEYFEE